MNNSPITRRFLHTHLWLPAAAFLLVIVVLEATGVDLWLADHIYAWSGSRWSLRDAWFTAVLVHEWGRTLVGIAVLVLLVATLASLVLPRLRTLRRSLLFLLLSALACGLLINLLKQLTHVDCPWDLLRYGGLREYVPTFAPLPPAAPAGACFPAGHASAAWAWLGLYYVALQQVPRWRWPLLVLVLLLGLVFGTAQQLRGAHFLSHDVWTLGLCWLLTTLLYVAFFRKATPAP